MPRREPVGSIRQPFNSGSGADDGLEFIYCVGGQQPEIHEVWTFGDDVITPEVHPFARVDVGAFIRDCFGTNYFAENGRRVPIFRRKSINGSVKWLGVPSFLRNDGPPWDDNILCPSLCWGVRGTYENGIWIVNLAVTTVVLTSRGVEPSLPVQITSFGVRKMCAPLYAASVTISFRSTVWHAPKFSRIPSTYSLTSWSIGRIAPWMIFGTNRYFNNFCGKVPLVV